MIDLILNIIAYVILLAFLIIPFTYYVGLVYWTIKNKWQSSIFKSKYIIILYFIFPPLSWYEASVQMNKKRKHIGGCSSLIISGFIFYWGFKVASNLSFLSLEHNLPVYYVYSIMLLFMFFIPICILVSEIVRWKNSKT